MADFALTLPRTRRSMVAIPRRDLVLDLGDSLTLALSLVESDRPNAEPSDIAGLGMRLRLIVVQDDGCCHDYGRPLSGRVLWSVLADIAPGMDGRATITIPRGAAECWHGRLSWAVQFERLDDVTLLACGALHLRHGFALAPAGYVITDTAGAAITTDTGLEIGAHG